jgi:putative peptide maturation dehydrogenase
VSRVRRTEFLFLRLREGPVLDLRLLLSGLPKLSSATQLYALSILTGAEFPISDAGLKILQQVPVSDWVPVEMLESICPTQSLVESLIQNGALLSNRNEERLIELVRRDEKLSSTKWNLYAALFHFMEKNQGIDIKSDWPEFAEALDAMAGASEKLCDAFVGRYGLPPSHFHEIPNAKQVIDLPLVRREESFYDLLRKRQTVRFFAKEKVMTKDQLSTLLYYVYGCQGYFNLSHSSIFGLKKTSPSGGALHPVEAYPLIIDVSDLDSGLYHYNVAHHALELISGITKREASELANLFTIGQGYPRFAHALVIMTARFYRNFWKYQQWKKAYAVLLMDVAHLSQTFYLVCAELGLGAFFTAGINEADIEEKLGIDGFAEGALAICGCGSVSEKESFTDKEVRSYTPRLTVL